MRLGGRSLVLLIRRWSCRVEFLSFLTRTVSLSSRFLDASSRLSLTSRRFSSLMIDSAPKQFIWSQEAATDHCQHPEYQATHGTFIFGRPNALQLIPLFTQSTVRLILPSPLSSSDIAILELTYVSRSRSVLPSDFRSHGRRLPLPRHHQQNLRSRPLRREGQAHGLLERIDYGNLAQQEVGVEDVASRTTPSSDKRSRLGVERAGAEEIWEGSREGDHRE